MGIGETLILGISAATLLGMIALVAVGLWRLDRASADEVARLRSAFEQLLNQIWRSRYQG
jgi:hypothetical protein